VLGTGPSCRMCECLPVTNPQCRPLPFPTWSSLFDLLIHDSAHQILQHSLVFNGGSRIFKRRRLIERRGTNSRIVTTHGHRHDHPCLKRGRLLPTLNPPLLVFHYSIWQICKHNQSFLSISITFFVFPSFQLAVPSLRS